MPKPKQPVVWTEPPHPVHGFLLPHEWEQMKNSPAGGAQKWKALSASRKRSYLASKRKKA